MREVDYTTVEDRKRVTAEALARGESVIHNDFIQGKPGDPDFLGRLTLDIKANPVVSVENYRLSELREKLSSKPLTLAEVNELLRLTLR